jgi:hypothetical protein
MRKDQWWVLMVSLLMVLVFDSLVMAYLLQEIIIQDPALKAYKKGPVTLSHVKHAEDYAIDCGECHHVYQDGKNVFKPGDPVKKCGQCHPVRENQGKLYKLSDGTAFHKICRDCHKARNKGPYQKCNECHGNK